MMDSTLPEDELSLVAMIEAMLFVSPTAVTANQIATALDRPTSDVEEGIKVLEARYVQPDAQHGLRLQHYRGRIQLTTAPEASLAVERLLGLEASSRLSRAALETLAIIAYRQPVTRPQIDAIRGVNSDGVMRGLLSKGLIEEGGRSETPGRPILFSVTPEFMQYFGLSSLDELPPLKLEELPALEMDRDTELLKE